MKEIVEQFEFEDKKYSLVGKYGNIEFLHRFIDGEFSDISAFVFVDRYNDGLPTPPKFYGTIVKEMSTILKYKGNYIIAVYERMPIIKAPEKICGNCKGFCRHYTESDNFLGIYLTNKGHCIDRLRVFDRNRDDKPKDDSCFNWNSECLGILKQLGIDVDNKI